MKQELLLLVGVAIVWSVLAAIYALAPGLDMPGYARVWGAGALVFLILAAVLSTARRRTKK
jgi:hypothetical protein